MTVEEMKREKTALGLTNEQVARRSGVPLSTVQKVFGGSTAAPRYGTLRALEKAFQKEASAPAGKGYASGSGPYEALLPSKAPCVREPEPAYAFARPQPAQGRKRQGEYTIDDYLAWPEDQRVELIDGVIYDMSAPSVFHQVIAGSVYYQLRSFADRSGHSCTPFISPADVQLDRDEKTIVQPDIFVVCGIDRLKELLSSTQGKRLCGAPDFVVEVLSPSTRAKDILIKAGKYQRAGVKEYWTVDPEHLTVMVYLFEADDLNVIPYTFADCVPVAVSGGECRIDFPDIRKQLELYQSLT